MKTRRRIGFLLLNVMLLGALPMDSLAQWTGNLNVVLGSKRFHDEDEWKPIDSQPGFGLLFDVRDRDWPLSLAVDFYLTGDQGVSNGVDRDGSTAEFNFGIRKIWRAGRSFRPFLGVGSSMIWANMESSAPGIAERSDSDLGAGIWIGGGLYWTLAESFNIGLHAKYSSAQVTLLDTRMDAGGNFFGTIIGLAW